ncbi:MAG: outer membrane beta-barrel protein [Hyphomonadaceae bacterium]
MRARFKAARISHTQNAGRTFVRNLLFAILIALHPLLAAGAANAQENDSPNVAVRDRPQPDYDPRGLRFGGFTIYPQANAEVAYTDNLFAEDVGERSDFVTTLSPSVRAETNWSRHRVRLDAGVQHVMHADFSDDDVTNYYVGGEGLLNVGSRGDIRARARYTRSSEPRYAVDSPTDAIEPIRYSQTDLALIATQEFNRLRLTGALERRDLDYDDTETLLGLIDQDDRDRVETTATLRGEYRLSPGVALLAQASFDQYDYDLMPPAVGLNRDSDGRTFLTGASFDITNLIRGQVAAGYFQREFDDPTLPEVSGLAIDTRIEWFPSQLTTVTATASRRVDDTAFSSAASFTAERIGLQVDHEFRRNLIASGRVGYTRRDFLGLNREDDVYSAEAGLTYRMNRRVGLRLGWRREDQRSMGANRDRDFVVNEVAAGVTFRL